MNEKQIAFIVCVNDEMKYSECRYYLERLRIPEGYAVEMIKIQDALSMAAGYNVGMKSSDAKYKVYLHQDVFIRNQNFISEILEVFAQDEQIGILGMIGKRNLKMGSAEMVMIWDTGRVIDNEYIWSFGYPASGKRYAEVQASDGLLLATQYDIPWREDLFDKWDFYDCSQSKEFERNGYKVVVPKLGKPWCIHDSGFVNYTHYHEERIKFLEEYGKEIPALEKQDSYKVTVVVTTHNQKDALQETLVWLKDVDGISNIIVVDNGSNDGTAAWLSSQQYEYLWFDEGAQGYGKLWNAALQNFGTEDSIVFMEAGMFPEKRCLVELAEALQTQETGIANPVSNYYGNNQCAINCKEELSRIRLMNQGQTGRAAFYKTLLTNWRIWAVRKDIIVVNGLFREEIKAPENVLADFSLRMIQKEYTQAVCPGAYVYESLRKSDEIYAEAGQWKFEDRVFLKAFWGMNYFNLQPNQLVVNCIQEERDKEFNVLEVGCDLGATLFAIKGCYPNCQTYGLDINEAAIDIAKHITKAEYGNIDELKVPFQEKFNYIIFGDVLEHLRHPEEVISMCRDLLTENGYIVASIPNLMHISVMEELIEGRFPYSDAGLLDRTHIHFFTYYEIMKMFEQAGYAVRDINRVAFSLSEREKEIIEVLLRFSDHTEDWMYETFQYIVKAQKKHVQIQDD